MSLLIARRVLFCRGQFRGLVNTTPSRSSTTLQEEAAKFFQKHAARRNPMSPYVRYKPQLTWLLSLSHRTTGIGLGLLLYGYGVSVLKLSESNFEQILQKTKQNFPNWFLQSVKFLAASSIAFHTFNGVRHLFWDAGLGFKLKHLYASGYTVIGLTALVISFILTKN